MIFPKVSVVMPVYNAQKYLCDAIESILSQDFTDFEFIIINDGSTDNTESIILSYQDDRIRYFKNPSNLKLCATLNKGFDLANGQYIARMDADDISKPCRLGKQVDLMDNQPKVGICGTFIQTFGSHQDVWGYPVSDQEIRCNMLLQSPFAHPAVMMRKSVLNKYNLRYRHEYEYCEDYDLWIRASFVTQFHNIPEILLDYRTHTSQITALKKHIYDQRVNDLRFALLKQLMPSVSSAHVTQWKRLAEHHFPTILENIRMVEKMLVALKRNNEQLRIYDVPTFNEFLFWRGWFPTLRCGFKTRRYYLPLMLLFLFSPFSRYYVISRVKKYVLRNQINES